MHTKILPGIKKATQQRSEQSIENILEAADTILSEPNADNLTTRMLSEISGYSIGALYHYLDKAEHAFILALFRRREKRLARVTEIINQYPKDEPLRDLLELLVDSMLEELNGINRRVFVLVSRMFVKHAKNHWLLDNAAAVLVDPLIRAQKRDATGTFRAIEHDELLMLLKLCAISLRRPFLEQDPIAGTQKHRDFVIDTMVRLLGNQA